MRVTIKKGDVVGYSFTSKHRGTVKVDAEIIDTYNGLYNAGVPECSIKYNDLGNAIVVHGVDARTLVIKGGTI